MNKWQIICPLAAMAIFMLVLGSFAHRNYSQQAYLPAAFQVGRDLVTKTNSSRLTSIAPDLRTNLLEFLGSPSRADSVRPLPAHEANKPTACISLVNDRSDRLEITLRWEPKLRKFTPVAFVYPAPPRHLPTKR